MMYIEQYSLLLDIQILLQTLKIALFPPETNAEEFSVHHNESDHKE